MLPALPLPRPAPQVTGDTRVLEEPQQGSGSGSGSSLATYQELCSLATDLGQPDLVYRWAQRRRGLGCWAAGLPA